MDANTHKYMNTNMDTHPIEAPLHTHTNSPNFILKYHPCHQINQSTKLPNSRFLLFSHRCTQTLGFNAYLSQDQDETGLTRLTRNTDWAFSSTKSEKTKKSTFSANAFDSTNFDFF